MIIYPAIDIKNGKCVRLVQGQFSDETVYSDNPVEMAKSFEQQGAEYIHVVDLDGARAGVPQNISIVCEMASKLGIPIQLGGGIRTIEIIESVLQNGVKRVILGTSAVKDQEMVRKAVLSFGSNLAVAIDARDGLVAIEGWAKTSSLRAVEFAKRIEELGCGTIIYTDISRDGMLSGPNLSAMEEMVKSVSVDVIASGGVSSLQDIVSLKNLGVSGAIVGKAIYNGNIKLEDAIAAAK